MSLIRHRQPVLTRLFPHPGNRRFLVPNRGNDIVINPGVSLVNYSDPLGFRVSGTGTPGVDFNATFDASKAYAGGGVHIEPLNDGGWTCAIGVDIPPTDLSRVERFAFHYQTEDENLNSGLEVLLSSDGTATNYISSAPLGTPGFANVMRKARDGWMFWLASDMDPRGTGADLTQIQTIWFLYRNRAGNGGTPGMWIDEFRHSYEMQPWLIHSFDDAHFSVYDILWGGNATGTVMDGLGWQRAQQNIPFGFCDNNGLYGQGNRMTLAQGKEITADTGDATNHGFNHASWTNPGQPGGYNPDFASRQAQWVDYTSQAIAENLQRGSLPYWVWTYGEFDDGALADARTMGIKAARSTIKTGDYGDNGLLFRGGNAGLQHCLTPWRGDQKLLAPVWEMVGQSGAGARDATQAINALDRAIELKVPYHFYGHIFTDTPSGGAVGNTEWSYEDLRDYTLAVKQRQAEGKIQLKTLQDLWLTPGVLAP